MSKFPRCKELFQELYDSQTPKENTGIFKIHSNTEILTPEGFREQLDKGSIVYLKNSLLHNDNGPAVIAPSIAGQLTILSYAIEGDYTQKEDVPAVVGYDRPVIFENGKFVPAKDSKIVYFIMIENSRRHSLKGPAYFDKNDSNKYYYYIEGEDLTKKEWLKDPRVILFQKKQNIKKKMELAFKEKA